MGVSSKLALPRSYGFSPERLGEANQAVVVDPDNYIPLLIFDKQFRRAIPDVARVGLDVVRLSIGGPFGFMREVGGGRVTLRTQKTEDIILAPSEKDAHRWTAMLDTPDPLTPLDRDTFIDGVNLYITRAAPKLHPTGSSPTISAQGRFLEVWFD